MRLALALVLLAACHHGPGAASPQSVPDALAQLAKSRDALHSFTGESVMDYWIGDQRIKGQVLVMGTVGSKVRMAALAPQGGVAVEMACDGDKFVYVDHQNNCAMQGPCTKQSIARFFHLELTPDDFLHLALGTPPVLDGAQGKAGAGGKIELTAPGGTQSIAFDGSDVTASEQHDAAGNLLWTVQNKDFVTVKDASGAAYRLPGKSQFKSSLEKSDLVVDWKDRQVNVDLAPDKFVVPVPEGLPECH
ncbi:MAG TPA: hypothetical protein VGM88_07960 [Kofleriaceae bacterium]|jgi:outer membrane lipoprotein-sorting protein